MMNSLQLHKETAFPGNDSVELLHKCPSWDFLRFAGQKSLATNDRLLKPTTSPILVPKKFYSGIHWIAFCSNSRGHIFDRTKSEWSQSSRSVPNWQTSTPLLVHGLDANHLVEDHLPSGGPTSSLWKIIALKSFSRSFPSKPFSNINL